MKSLVLISIFVGLTSAGALAQYGYTINDLYQYNYTTVSPAFAGVDGEKMTLAGSLFFRDNGEYRGYGFMGYETSVDKINSGVGFSLSRNQVQITTFTNMNFLYNYQLDLGDQKKLVFGLKLTGSQFSVDHSGVIIPIGNLDPAIYAGAFAANTFTSTAAVLYRNKKFFAGLSVDNVTSNTNKLYGLAVFTGYYDKQFNLIVGRDFRISEKISSTHSLYVVKNEDFWRVDINNSFVFYNWLIAGASLEVNNEDADNQIWPKANVGFNIKNKARFIFSAYSEAYNTGGSKFRGQTMIVFNLQ